MKTKNIYMLLLMLVAAVFTSCDKDSGKNTEEAYFNFMDASELTSPTGYDVATAGNKTGTQFTIRSNKSWKIVEEAENDWVKFFPNEGDKDGLVKIIVKENKTFVDRTMHFTFIVDGEAQPVLFTVNQAKAVPTLSIMDKAGKPLSLIDINQAEQTVSALVKANVTYSFSSNVNWITSAGSVPGSESTELKFNIAANDNKTQRIGTISFTSSERPELNTTLTVKQQGSEGKLVLFEDFSWLNYPLCVYLYDANNPVRFDSWTAEQVAKGWTSTPNTFSSNQQLLYAFNGCAKLGKTSYAGDLISPKLSAIQGTATVVVTFKAVPYMTAAGTKDDNLIIVSALNAGTVSQSEFTIDNWPDYTNDPYATALWQKDETTRTFTITGATSDTQIKFLAGRAYNLVGVGAGKNRMFIDDIKVLIPSK